MITNKTTDKFNKVKILLATVDVLTPTAKTKARNKHNPAAKKSTYSAKYGTFMGAADKNASAMTLPDILLTYSLIPFATLAAPVTGEKLR